MHVWEAGVTKFLSLYYNLILNKIVMLSSVKVCSVFSRRERVQVFNCLFISVC